VDGKFPDGGNGKGKTGPWNLVPRNQGTTENEGKKKNYEPTRKDKRGVKMSIRQEGAGCGEAIRFKKKGYAMQDKPDKKLEEGKRKKGKKERTTKKGGRVPRAISGQKKKHHMV